MIQEINKTLLSPAEARTLASRMTDILISMNLPDDYFKKLTEHIKLAAEDLDRAMGRDRKSKHGELLDAADEKRDNCFISFKHYIKSCSNRPLPAVNEAAKRITGLIEKYGTTLYTKNYTEQSVKTNLLLDELAGQYGSDIDTLKAGPWIEDMKKSQQDFEKIVNEKIEDAAEKNIPTLYRAKNDLLNLIVLLIVVMNKMPLFYPGVRDDKIKQMEEVVSKVMASARARETRNINIDD